MRSLGYSFKWHTLYNAISIFYAWMLLKQRCTKHLHYVPLVLFRLSHLHQYRTIISVPDTRTSMQDTKHQCIYNANPVCSELQLHPVTIVLVHLSESQQADHTFYCNLKSYKHTQKYTNSDNQVHKKDVVIPHTPLLPFYYYIYFLF